MGIFEKFLPAEDRRAALLLYGMVIPICFNGYDAGIMTVILDDSQFKEYYHVDSIRSGVIAVAPWAFIGLSQLFVAGTLARAIGRLWTIRCSILLVILGVVIQVIPNSYGVLILGRLLTGLATGCIAIAVSLYVAECAPANMRGSFVGTVTQFGYQLGSLIAFWSGYGMASYKEPFQIAWRVSNLIQVPIGLLFIILSFWYPESPRWLLEKYPNDPQRALKQLAFVRSGNMEDDRVRLEFHELVASHQFRRRFEPGYMGIFKSPALRKRLAYGFYVTGLQQIGGIAAVTMFAVVIYRSLGWNEPRQSLIINGIQGVLQLFIVLVNTFTVDRFGRRPLLIAGFSIQSLALLIMASLTTGFPQNNNKPAAVIEVAMLFIVGLTYCWSNGPMCFAIASEIFPQHVREKAFALSLLGQTVFLIALTQPWPYINERIGGRSYWILFSLNVAALISVILILPETKGVSLERMDKIFGEVDYVEAGERETGTEVIELDAYSSVHPKGELKHRLSQKEEVEAAKV